MRAWHRWPPRKRAWLSIGRLHFASCEGKVPVLCFRRWAGVGGRQPRTQLNAERSSAPLRATSSAVRARGGGAGAHGAGRPLARLYAGWATRLRSRPASRPETRERERARRGRVMQILIKTLTGRQQAFNFDATSKVLEVKHAGALARAQWTDAADAHCGGGGRSAGKGGHPGGPDPAHLWRQANVRRQVARGVFRDAGQRHPHGPPTARRRRLELTCKRCQQQQWGLLLYSGRLRCCRLARRWRDLPAHFVQARARALRGIAVAMNARQQRVGARGLGAHLAEG